MSKPTLDELIEQTKQLLEVNERMAKEIKQLRAKVSEYQEFGVSCGMK